MQPLILSVATATPKHKIEQSTIAQLMVDLFALSPEQAAILHNIYAQSSIQHRYSVLKDFGVNKSDWSFLKERFQHDSPGMLQRNELYKKEALPLAQEAALAAIDRWKGNPHDLTHVISVSCTGMMAPGIEFHLMQALHLNRSIHRLGINFMGCFGAFRGLQVAAAIAKEDPAHRILLVCTELCSLHLQPSTDNDAILANSLFADGSAAAIVGCQARPHESPHFSIVRQSALGLDDSLDKMTWDAGNHGFFMRLSSYVPALIKKHVHKIIDPLLQNDVAPTACEWAIHAGGKSILQAAERALNLSQEQTQAGWDTLRDYGNMSSATFLFVLERLCRRQNKKKWTAGLGFGPGLSMEGILLQKVAHE